jgi:hypothetical protein
MVILGPRILCEEVACILITTKPLIVSAGHTRSFDTIPLRESTKSTLLVHVLVLT